MVSEEYLREVLEEWIIKIWVQLKIICRSWSTGLVDNLLSSLKDLQLNFRTHTSEGEKLLPKAVLWSQAYYGMCDIHTHACMHACTHAKNCLKYPHGAKNRKDVAFIDHLIRTMLFQIISDLTNALYSDLTGPCKKIFVSTCQIKEFRTMTGQVWENLSDSRMYRISFPK